MIDEAVFRRRPWSERHDIAEARVWCYCRSAYFSFRTTRYGQACVRTCNVHTMYVRKRWLKKDGQKKDGQKNGQTIFDHL